MIYRRIINIFCFFAFSFSLAQNTPISSGKIQLKIGVSDKGIMLRWAVDEPLAWQKSKFIGFVLKRYTLMREGKLLENPEEKKLGVFLPASEEKWKSIIATNDNAAIVAQSLFGEGFEVEMGSLNNLQGIINQSQEIEQRFSFALMAADLDFEVAQLAGWGFVDSTATPNERYLYSVELNPSTNSKKLNIEKGSGIAELSMPQTLPPPIDFIGIFADKQVTLAWDYQQLNDTYTAYFIEKAEENGAFTPLGHLPVMNMNDSAKGMIFIDSLGDNNKKYSYRLRGKTIFGSYGAYSAIVSGFGKKALGASPRILSFTFEEKQSILLGWDFPIEAEKDISGFELLHSSTDEENSYKVIKTGILANKRSVVTESISGSNYYKIRAIGAGGDHKESFAVLVQPPDDTPPISPKEFSGKIDSLGVVHLKWKSNTEKDLEGYHIFRGIQKEEEFVRITPQALTENQYQDTIILENLNSKVYYYITATDQRKNQSKPSEILELEKPDKVKPQSPVFYEYVLENNGDITLKWLKSASEDVAVYQLFRKEKDKEKGHLIYQTKEIRDHYTYTDKNTTPNQKYIYSLEVVDRNNLRSQRPSEITLQSHRITAISGIGSLWGTVYKDKKYIELLWKNQRDDIVEILVYRQKNDEKPSLWGTLSGGQNYLEDKSVSLGNSYQYFLKPLLKNQQVAKTEKIIIEY